MEQWLSSVHLKQSMNNEHVFIIPSSEQTKKFRQLFKSDPTAATSMAFDEIVLMDNQPDKYMRLLLALKDAGTSIRLFLVCH